MRYFIIRQVYKSPAAPCSSRRVTSRTSAVTPHITRDVTPPAHIFSLVSALVKATTGYRCGDRFRACLVTVTGAVTGYNEMMVTGMTGGDGSVTTIGDVEVLEVSE